MCSFTRVFNIKSQRKMWISDGSKVKTVAKGIRTRTDMGNILTTYLFQRLYIYMNYLYAVG